MRFAGAGVGSRGTVATKHRGRAPAGETHQVRLAAALSSPLVAEGVAELVRVQARQAGLLTSATDHLLDAVGGEPAALPKPQPR